MTPGVASGGTVLIRHATDADIEGLLAVERAAFAGDSEAKLVVDLLGDPSAAPIINLVAENNGEIVGHVMFTRARIDGSGAGVEATVLAPLAVAPAAQGTGVGGALARAGIAAATERGIELVFVLGHIDYYPRFGFAPALKLGLRAPYPIDPAVEAAWMVLETRPGLLGTVRGNVVCADAMMHPEMWRE
ncbi:MAG: N-acetyltransferase [Coriobacteriia bacterium]|nr:N-acetyltransferase [Coriobacteriia bacterium]